MRITTSMCTHAHPRARDQVAQRILAGETLLILQDKVIRVPPSWLNAHPGGALAIPGDPPSWL